MLHGTESLESSAPGGRPITAATTNRDDHVQQPRCARTGSTAGSMFPTPQRAAKRGDPPKVSGGLNEALRPSPRIKESEESKNPAICRHFSGVSDGARTHDRLDHKRLTR